MIVEQSGFYQYRSEGNHAHFCGCVYVWRGGSEELHSLTFHVTAL